MPGLMSNFLPIKMDIRIYVGHYTGKTVAPTRIAENDSDGSSIIVWAALLPRNIGSCPTIHVEGILSPIIFLNINEDQLHLFMTTTMTVTSWRNPYHFTTIASGTLRKNDFVFLSNKRPKSNVSVDLPQHNMQHLKEM